MSDGQYGKSWHEYKYCAYPIDSTTAFAYNDDFLVIAHENRIYVYHEDDGMFIYRKNDGFNFNSAFTYSLISLLSEMQNYITLVGIPYHDVPGRTIRCGFALGIEIDKSKED